MVRTCLLLLLQWLLLVLLLLRPGDRGHQEQ
jgi:hypothetical protein